ncbi:hypothetical protein GGI20_002548 [Coemansia sp. BCRC 34301]|nr:hypothetical protein GGI20_002548 [Coemansia sp. BCRC 34301]
MKSIVMSIFLFTNAGGSILAFCFNSIAANPHLVENFAIVSGLMGAFTILFFVCFRHYDQRDADEIMDKTMFEKKIRIVFEDSAASSVNDQPLAKHQRND